MPQSLPDTTPPKRRFRWPTGMPQLAALLLVLLVDSLVAPHFWQVVLQDGRLFGSPIDILNRAAPVALLAIGMTLVIATGGIDLSVGAVMAIAGATTAAMTVAGFSLPIVLLSALGTGILAGLWNGILVLRDSWYDLDAHYDALETRFWQFYPRMMAQASRKAL